MKIKCLILFFLLFGTFSTYADEVKLTGENETITEGQKIFIEHYIEIINSKNEKNLNNIIHPLCIKQLKKYPSILKSLMERRFSYSIPKDYTISIKNTVATDPLPFEKSFN